jgi:exodeoxyribonuclease VII small subunit
MATDGGKQRPAESGAEGKTDGKTNGKAEDRTDGRPAAKATKAAKTSSPDTDPAGHTPRLPYEQARDQLTELVKRLEAGGLTLEQSLELWERGERLAAICEEWLEGARARLAAAMAQRTDHEPAPGTPF